jgi:hypothetical protein
MIVLLHISADQYRGTNDSFPPVEIPWLDLGDGRNGARADEKPDRLPQIADIGVSRLSDTALALVVSKG